MKFPGWGPTGQQAALKPEFQGQWGRRLTVGTTRQNARMVEISLPAPTDLTLYIKQNSNLTSENVTADVGLGQGGTALVRRMLPVTQRGWAQHFVASSITVDITTSLAEVDVQAFVGLGQAATWVQSAPESYFDAALGGSTTFPCPEWATEYKWECSPPAISAVSTIREINPFVFTSAIRTYAEAGERWVGMHPDTTQLEVTTPAGGQSVSISWRGYS